MQAKNEKNFPDAPVFFQQVGPGKQLGKKNVLY